MRSIIDWSKSKSPITHTFTNFISGHSFRKLMESKTMPRILMKPLAQASPATHVTKDKVNCQMFKILISHLLIKNSRTCAIGETSACCFDFAKDRTFCNFHVNSSSKHQLIAGTLICGVLTGVHCDIITLS